MKPQYRDAAERTAALTEIWRRVLGDEQLDEGSDLFECGASSFHVLEIVAQVYDVLNVDVKLRAIFDHASPRSLSAALEPEPSGAAPSPPAPRP